LQDEEEFVEYANLESGWNSSVTYHDLSWPAGSCIKKEKERKRKKERIY
jgi:hypothetical protein